MTNSKLTHMYNIQCRFWLTLRIVKYMMRPRQPLNASQKRQKRGKKYVVTLNSIYRFMYAEH